MRHLVRSPLARVAARHPLSATLATLAALAGLAAPVAAQAQAPAPETYPARPMQVIVPLSAGSQMDLLGRALATGLASQTGQPVVVMNRDGAGMIVGMDAIAKARPDGYTIGFGPDGPLSLSPHLNPNLPFKPADFELVCRTNTTNIMLVVGPQSPHKSFEDLVEAAKREPGKLSYGTPGIGTSMHLLMEALALERGVKFNHVPFKNIGDLSVQTLNGSLDFAVTVPNTLAVNAPRGMRGLLMTGSAPLPDLPVVPLVRDVVAKDSPLAAYVRGNVGLYAPRGTPAPALDWLRRACKAAAEAPAFVAASAKTFTPHQYADGPEFLKAMQQGSRTSGELVKKLGISLQ